MFKKSSKKKISVMFRNLPPTPHMLLEKSVYHPRGWIIDKSVRTLFNNLPPTKKCLTYGGLILKQVTKQPV